MTHVLLTRPKQQAESFAALLQQMGIAPDRIVISPIMTIEPTGVKPGLGDVIITSANAVQMPGLGRRAYCVGEVTTKIATDAGFDAICGGTNVDQLCDYINTQVPSGHLIYMRGAHVMVDIHARLVGREVIDCCAYRQVGKPLTSQAIDLLQGGTPVVLPLFSPRSAALLRDTEMTWDQHIIVAISENAASPFRDVGVKVIHVAKRPDAKSMANTISKVLEVI